MLAATGELPFDLCHHPGLAANTGRSDRSLVAKFGISRQFERAWLIWRCQQAGPGATKIMIASSVRQNLPWQACWGTHLTGSLSRQWTRVMTKLTSSVH